MHSNYLSSNCAYSYECLNQNLLKVTFLIQKNSFECPLNICFLHYQPIFGYTHFFFKLLFIEFMYVSYVCKLFMWVYVFYFYANNVSIVIPYKNAYGIFVFCSCNEFPIVIKGFYWLRII